MAPRAHKAVSSTRSAGLVAAVALMMVSCGGNGATEAAGPSSPRGAPVTRHGPRAQIPHAGAVPMTNTPWAVLSFCRRNHLLRPVCPRRIPTSGRMGPSGGRQTYYCDTGDRQETVRESVQMFPTTGCVFAQWGYEVARPLLVHVDEAAGSAATVAKEFVRPQGTHRVTDELLSPRRRHAVSLGWVRWYGIDGQLVLAPPYPLGGEWGGHLILYVPPGADRVSYAITLHAWIAEQRRERSPALPQVIATLKAIVGSTELAAAS